MRDKRPVDEISITELERILAIRKREERRERLRRFDGVGRRLPAAAPIETPEAPGPVPDPPPAPPTQHEAAANLPPLEPPSTYDLTDDVPRFEDEMVQPTAPDPVPDPVRRDNGHSPGTNKPTKARTAFDRVLLAVEVVAVIGVVVVLAIGGYLLMVENDKLDALDAKSAALQQEAVALQATATPAPELTIRLSDYVLPGGHYSPDQTGGYGVFNVDELPASIRPRALAQIQQGVPQADLVSQRTETSPVEIDIPAINVRASIYPGDDWSTLIKGVGHYQGSANPGENGNMVLSAHNDIYGETFRYIEDLQPGDKIHVDDTSGRRYTYVVREKLTVEPSDTWVLERGNRAQVTLITCWPYRVDTHRMIVFGDLVE